MNIGKYENQIVGKWLFSNGKNVIDKDCERINGLISNYLKKIATDKTGWNILFQDPTDKRYWELIYPNSEMHGGGPPALMQVSETQAQQKYNI